MIPSSKKDRDCGIKVYLQNVNLIDMPNTVTKYSEIMGKRQKYEVRKKQI